jgi:uncharacterized protein (DUF305 family)
VEQTSNTTEPMDREPDTERSPLIVAAAILVMLISVVAVAWAVLRTAHPGESSVEAGFARDMSEHHDQAVEMALIIQQRAENEELRFIVTDMMLTQQAQIGQMRGWLDVWGLHPSSEGTKMAWMDHPTTGLMPGMASPEQIQQLHDLPVQEAEGYFLELMIIHHQAGVEMAEAAIDRTNNEAVVRLAEAIYNAQVSEIENLQRMRDILGFERVDVQPQIHDDHDHD